MNQADGVINETSPHSWKGFELEMAKVYDFSLNVLLLSIIVLSGIIGNGLSFLLLYRDKPHRATHIILSSLSVIDSIFLLTSLSMFTIPYFLTNPTSIIYRVYVFSGPYLYTLGHTMRMMRNWTGVIISFERWLAVSKPLKAAYIWTNGTASKGMFLLIFTTAIYCIPRFFEMTTITTTKVIADNETVEYKEIDYSALQQNPFYNMAYRICGYFLFVIGGPVSFVTIFNILIIISIRAANNQRKDMKRQQLPPKSKPTISSTKFKLLKSFAKNLLPKTNVRQSLNGTSCRRLVTTDDQNFQEITLICIIILLCYSICETPPLISQIMLTVNEVKFERYVKVLLPIGNFSTSLHSAINFYIYVFFGRRFRQHFAELCRGVRRRNMSGAVNMMRFQGSSRISRSSTTGQFSMTGSNFKPSPTRNSHRESIALNQPITMNLQSCNEGRRNIRCMIIDEQEELL